MRDNDIIVVGVGVSPVHIIGFNEQESVFTKPSISSESGLGGLCIEELIGSS